MAQSKQALRTRIKSVNSTKKITKAMEMIANAKLFKQRSRMEANRDYAQKLQDTVDEICASNQGVDHVYLKKRSSTKKAVIVFCSDLGLCGGYNANVMRMAKEEISAEDTVILIGTSLYRQMSEAGFALYNEEPISSDRLTFNDLKKYITECCDMYLKNEVGTVELLYTKFINTISFKPAVDVLLPFTKTNAVTKQEEGMHAETLFEPSPEVILDTLIPMMIQDVAYSDWMESTTSEQGSRRAAMKTASDNADELSNDLLLEYNKARQSAITQEITEIVGGSEAV